MFERQIQKLGTAMRVIDSKNIQRHFNEDEIKNLYSTDKLESQDFEALSEDVADEILKKLFADESSTEDYVVKCIEMEEMLKQHQEEPLTAEQIQADWETYQGDFSVDSAVFKYFNHATPADIEKDEIILGFKKSTLTSLLYQKAGKNNYIMADLMESLFDEVQATGNKENSALWTELHSKIPEKHIDIDSDSDSD